MHISNDAFAQKPLQSQIGNNSDQQMHISREHYNQLMTLLHSSKKDTATSSQHALSNHNTDPSLHIVSTLSQSGIPQNSASHWILDSWHQIMYALISNIFQQFT